MKTIKKIDVTKLNLYLLSNFKGYSYLINGKWYL